MAAGGPASMAGTLRFLTCGSVDDGKSTLVGRLLADAGLVPQDQLAACVGPGGAPDYAHLLDGLQAEREQGITIDVAYRYFATARRKFIVADCPGHEQFTRNMATGASVSALALLLVDAAKGLRLQTRRHATIAAVMGIREVALAVNKMDLAGYDERVFQKIVDEFRSHADQLGLQVTAIPVSARQGDNVVHASPAMRWYEGPTVLAHLEAAAAEPARRGPLRFPVQRVSRPVADFRGYQGTISSGHVRPGDTVVALPGGHASRVARIVTFDGDVEEAVAGQAVTLVLADDVEAGRGTVFASADTPPAVVDRFVADLVCMSDQEISSSRDLLLRTRTMLVPARIAALRHRLDVVSLSQEPARSLVRNEIGSAVIATDRPVVLERYRDNRDLGAFLLVDRITNETVAAGMVTEPVESGANIFWQKFQVRPQDRPLSRSQVPAIVWLTGPSGAGKSTIAGEIERLLVERGCSTYVLDGDNVRHGLNRDLGFSEEERRENVRRLAEVARILADAGLIAVVAAISPYARDRAQARATAGDIGFYEAFVDTPLDICAQRDPKGLYRQARAGRLKDFTGVDAPYERPAEPDLHLDGSGKAPESEARRVLDWLAAHGHIHG
jgi:bifunctional enzyme CysN/CysC